MTPIEEYILSCPLERRERLFALRSLILEAVPELKECVSWGMPTFRLTKNVIHFALHKAHVGVYPGPEAILRFKEELKGFKSSKGAFQLPLSGPLPEALIRDMARWCAEHPGL